MPAADFEYTLYNKPEYYAELLRSIATATAGDRISLMVMDYDPSLPTVEQLSQAMMAAAKRGVQLQLVIDAHTFIINDRNRLGPLFFSTKKIDSSSDSQNRFAGMYAAIYDNLQQLGRSGVSWRITNLPRRPFQNPFGSRSHIKLAIVNDQLFIGGCNFDEADHLDMMVSWRDRATAQRLRQFIDATTATTSVRAALNYQDQTFEISSNASIFIDAGVRRQSIILDQAYRLIDAASERLLITCQYFPGGITAEHLLAAHRRGVAVEIYYSPPSRHGAQAAGQWLYNQSQRRQFPASFFVGQLSASKPKLHAKIIASESTALIGSHNYVQIGVNFGTAEIGLLVDGPQFAAAVADRMRATINQSV